jgi:hypothetical protein
MTAITGLVYADTNDNGTHDSGEPGVPGIEITYDSSNNTATAGDGTFTVSGAATSGTHYVGISTPSGWTLTQPTANSGRYINSGSNASLAFGIEFTPNLTADAPSASEVDLAWSNADASLRAVIRRSSDEGSTWTTLTSSPLSSGTTSYADTDTALTPGTEYEYSLTMVDSSDNPIASSTVVVSTLAGTLNTPHDTSMTISSTSLWGLGATGGSGMTASLQTGTTPQGGSVTANDDGSWTYTPPSDWIGSDTVMFTLSDGTTTTAPAPLTVKVTDQAPWDASLYATTTNFDPTVSTNAAAAISADEGGFEGVNASDADGDSLTYHLVNADGTTATADSSGNVATAHGEVSMTSDGTYTYTPGAGFVGYDRFFYVANDGIENGNVASVTIEVSAGVPLIAVPDVLDTEGVGVPFTFSLDSGQYSNIDTSQLQVLSQPANGSVSLDGGNLVYTAAESGLASFTFGYGSNVPSSTLLVDVDTGYDFTWGGLGNQTFSVSHGDTLPVGGEGILDGVGYSPGGSLAANLVSGPTAGTLDLASDGTFTYTPAANTVGWMYFNYNVHVGSAVSPTATDVIDVTDTMPLESSEATNLSTTPGTSVTFDLRTPFVDTEHPLDQLSTTIPTGLGPRNGSVTVNSDGTLTYTPNAGFAGIDSFTYQINDGVTDASFGSISQTDSLNSGYSTVYIDVAPA